MNSHRRCKS